MKRFLRKSWHGIPIGLIATVFIGTAVVAAGAYITVNQLVTQQISEPEPEPEPAYGSITAPDLILPSVEANHSFTKTFANFPKVELGPDGAGKALKMVCTPDSKYTSFSVTITLKEKPVGSTVGLYGYSITGGGEVSVDLDLEGTYIFDQKVNGRAGSSTGSAESTITFTLEDSTTPPK